MVKRKVKDEAQLSLFESNEPQASSEISSTASRLTTAVDFVRAKFEQNPDMSPEEYKRWIRILVHSSLRRME